MGAEGSPAGDPVRSTKPIGQAQRNALEYVDQHIVVERPVKMRLPRQRALRGPEWIAVEAPIVVANAPRTSSRVRASAKTKTTSIGALRVRSMRRVAWKTSAAQVSTSGAQ